MFNFFYPYLQNSYVLKKKRVSFVKEKLFLFTLLILFPVAFSQFFSTFIFFPSCLFLNIQRSLISVCWKSIIALINIQLQTIFNSIVQGYFYFLFSFCVLLWFCIWLFFYISKVELMASYIVNDVNPQEWLTDVLIRIHDHTIQKPDELLPHLWKLNSN